MFMAQVEIHLLWSLVNKTMLRKLMLVGKKGHGRLIQLALYYILYIFQIISDSLTIRDGSRVLVLKDAMRGQH